MKHVHFIGIGGTGLSAIARILLEKGFKVSGSDQVASPLFEAITAAGAQTFVGHSSEHVAGADLVIRSSAISDENPEVITAKEHGIPVLKRADFLAELTVGKCTIAVAGSHGKTTTTGMIIWMLEQLGNHPSFILGSVINQLGINARSGSGDHFVIEADEYDNMFLGLVPNIAVITNIEHDHPDFFPTKAIYRQAFKNFIGKVQPDGIRLLCLDDIETKSLFDELGGKFGQIFGYGLHPDANYQPTEINFAQGRSSFDFLYRNSINQVENLGRATLRLAGHHNVLNATAALAVMHQLGFQISEAAKALETFEGTQRRFEVIGCEKDITLIDDYGHHPTEIAATIYAARSQYPGQRVWAIWQPHTFTRTQTMEDRFIDSLNLADQVVVLKIYAAREINHGYSAEKIAQSLPSGRAKYYENFASAADYLLENLSEKDVAIFFSAGDATALSQMVLKGLCTAKGLRND